MAEEGFIMVPDSPERHHLGPEWTLYPYVFRTKVPVPVNDIMSKREERKVSKCLAKILRWDVPANTILTLADLSERLHKEVSHDNIRNVCVSGTSGSSCTSAEEPTALLNGD
jgi:hypothetical protein